MEVDVSDLRCRGVGKDYTPQSQAKDVAFFRAALQFLHTYWIFFCYGWFLTIRNCYSLLPCAPVAVLAVSALNLAYSVVVNNVDMRKQNNMFKIMLKKKALKIYLSDA